MALQEEVVLNFGSIPLFNIIKYFFASVLFGTVLDTAAATIDSALSRQELCRQGWSSFPGSFLPRVNRAGLGPKLSRRTMLGVLAVILALTSDIFDELSYDAKEVSINFETSNVQHIIIQNGTVTSPALYSAVGQLAFEVGLDCFGKVREGYYADRTIIVWDDGQVGTPGNQTGLRRHFLAKCGLELLPGHTDFPIAVVRNTEKVDNWLKEAGASSISDTSLPFGIKMSGPSELEYGENISAEERYDLKYTTFETYTVQAVFPRARWFCIAAVIPKKQNIPAHLLCWYDKSVVLLVLSYEERETSLGDFKNSKRLILGSSAAGGEVLASGITDLSGFLSWCVTFISYSGPAHESPLNAILSARLTVLTMRYAHEFAGREVSAERAIRPVIRMAFFLPSLVIVASCGLIAIILVATRQTTELTSPNGLARYLCCPNGSQRDRAENDRSRNVYLILRENECSQEQTYHVSLSADVRDVHPPKLGRPLYGLSGCLQKRKR